MAAPNTHVKVAGAWKRVKQIHVKVSGTWKKVNYGYVRTGGVWKRIFQSRTAVNLTISAATNNYNIFTAAGSPAGVVDVVLTINSGIFVRSTSTASPALIVGGAFASGSTLTIINNGYILGKGGAGGNGTPGYYAAGAAGGNGGHAINFSGCNIANISVNNTSGYIFGGGGGGGGAGSWYWAYVLYNYPGAPGGGGGAGGGAAGTATGIYVWAGPPYHITGAIPTNGAAGTDFAAGGAGAVGMVYQDGGEAGTYYAYSGSAGAGGGSGAIGASSSVGYPAGIGTPPPYHAPGPAALPNSARGNPGQAIVLGGVGITWLGGNNGAQVKGVVS